MTTHTYAILKVSARAHQEIRAKLEQAGYGQAFHDDDVIDMHGIAVQPERLDGTIVDAETAIEVGTILSARTKQGMVEFVVNGEKAQMDLEKAREVLGMLGGAIEAAVSDGLIYAFLTGKVGLSDEKASMALLDFRELRQGSRSTVYPN